VERLPVSPICERRGHFARVGPLQYMDQLLPNRWAIHTPSVAAKKASRRNFLTQTKHRLAAVIDN
jgi:hypothetical protein